MAKLFLFFVFILAESRFCLVLRMDFSNVIIKFSTKIGHKVK